jgi:hypothetical protein
MATVVSLASVIEKSSFWSPPEDYEEWETLDEVMDGVLASGVMNEEELMKLMVYFK